MDLAAFIDRYDRAWNEQDVDAIMSMHARDMVFENHTRGVRVEGEAARAHIVAIFRNAPDLAFRGRRLYVRDGLVVNEWTASATLDGRRAEWDGVDVIPIENGLLKRKDVYSSSHNPRTIG